MDLIEKYLGENKVLNLITKKVYDVFKKRRDAIYRGKRSKATVNIKLLSKKTEIPENILDLAVGMGTMAALNGEESTRKAIEQILKQNGIKL